jgi:plasmid maintenance system antidote protein VapI
MAIRLGAALSMTPEFWLNAQQAVDIYRATRRIKKVPRPIRLAS